jgi:anaerobic selenocysteine-containing dehydrogenase
MTTRSTSACPLDCPDACSLEVTIEDNQVRRVEGTRLNPVTDGFICAKVSRFADHLYCPERLTHPGFREGPKGEGRFRKVSWDEALDRIASRLTEVRRTRGGEAILPYYYGGSNGPLTQNATDARLFRRLGASRIERTLCAAATGRAASGLYGKMPGVAFTDYPKAELIIVWGCNPGATGIHLVPLIRKAQKAGARLVVVDPRVTPLASHADLHIAVRPGTDLPVALSLLRWLFENGRADLEFLAAHATGTDALRERALPWTFERAARVAGVAAADLESLARLYADSSPAVVRCGWGLERNRNGGSAVAAVLALPAVAGKFGVRGSGYTLSNSGGWKLGSGAEEPEPPTRMFNMNRLGEILGGAEAGGTPIEVLFVYNCNPAMTVPNQERVRAGLLREDLFTVVFDQVMTDTARFADVVLPATTFLEHSEIARGYGAMILQTPGPVIPPVGEARPNYDVFADLCRRTGVARPGDAQDAASLSRLILGDNGNGVDFQEQIRRNGAAYAEFGPEPVQFVDIFPQTPDRKIHLFPPELDDEAPLGLYGYQDDPATAAFPLALISPSTTRTVSSTFGQLNRKQVPLEIHPADADPRNLQDGDTVRVFNPLGEMRCLVRRNPGLRPGVVSMPKGLWSHNTLNGATTNALSPDTGSDLGQSACFNDARVEVERISS